MNKLRFWSLSMHHYIPALKYLRGGVVNFVVLVAFLPLPAAVLLPPYVAVQRSVTVQSSGEDGSVCVPQASGLDLLRRTHTTLKGTPRGCTRALVHTHTHADIRARTHAHRHRLDMWSAHMQFRHIQAHPHTHILYIHTYLLYIYIM